MARPFFAIAELEHTLDGVELLIDDQSYSYETEIPIEETVNQESPIVIKANLDLVELEKVLSKRLGDFALLLSARSPKFKRRKLLDSWSLVNEIPETILLEDYDTVGYEIENELDLTIAIALAKRSDPCVGWPHQKGSWIAKQTFSFREKKERSTFDLRPMSPQEAENYTDFSGALIHVKIDGDLFDDELPKDDMSPIIAFVAEDVYGAIVRNPTSPLQEILESEILSDVLIKCTEEIQSANRLSKKSPIGGAIEKLKIPLQEIQEYLRTPDRVKALIHDRLAISDSLSKL